LRRIGRFGNVCSRSMGPRDALTDFLPYLAAAAAACRESAGRKHTHVAVFVRKRNGAEGVSDSTVSRFELGRHWPEDADAMVQAYGRATGCHPFDLYARALRAWADDLERPAPVVSSFDAGAL
jgi:hypothetical protein